MKAGGAWHEASVLRYNRCSICGLIPPVCPSSVAPIFSFFFHEEYTNRLNKMQAIKERDLGVPALQETLISREAEMVDDIRERFK